MNICMIASGWLPVHGGGGIEVYVKSLIEGLLERDHTVTLITTAHPDGIKKEEYKNGLIVYHVGDRPFSYTNRFYKDSADLFKKLNKQEGFDVAHTQDYAGYGYYKSESKIPSVVTAMGTPINVIKSFLKVRNPRSFPQLPRWTKYHFSVAPAIFHRSDKIISISNELCMDIISQYKVPREKIAMIPVGVDVEKFKPKDSSKLKQEFGINNEKIVMFVGSINKNKGVHILLKALKMALDHRNDLRLVIVGEGPYMNKIRKMADRLKIKNNVIFTGKVHRKDLPDYYNIADVVVVPTIGMEALGNVNVEAMACGRPVIASQVGGIPTAIEHFKEGILVKPNNPVELSEKILELLNNEKIAENLGRAGRKKAVEKFSLDVMIESTIKIYREVCK